jgi:hypothetical protein
LARLDAEGEFRLYHAAVDLAGLGQEALAHKYGINGTYLRAQHLDRQHCADRERAECRSLENDKG